MVWDDFTYLRVGCPVGIVVMVVLKDNELRDLATMQFKSLFEATIEKTPVNNDFSGNHHDIT